MSVLDLEVEYNNRARVPEHPDIQVRWAKASEAWRREGQCDADIRYGSGERCRYDLFRPKDAKLAMPVVVYIHGGYWQRGDRKDNSFLAKELNRRGIAVAVPSYTLCPACGVMDIVAEMRACLKAVHERTRQRLVVVGHSAGGHLAAAMLATDWSKVPGVPADLVTAAYAISGVFDVVPLVPTSLNVALRLDEATAKAASPLGWPAPAKARTFVAAAGGDESQEFMRQSLEIADVWSRAGVKAECVIVPGTNHFTIVEELANPESAMLARVVAMAKA